MYAVKLTGDKFLLRHEFDTLSDCVLYTIRLTERVRANSPDYPTDWELECIHYTDDGPKWLYEINPLQI